jgi:hypothetical protein
LLPRAELVEQRFTARWRQQRRSSMLKKLGLDLAIVLDVAAEVNNLYVTGWRRELS